MLLVEPAIRSKQYFCSRTYQLVIKLYLYLPATFETNMKLDNVVQQRVSSKVYLITILDSRYVNFDDCNFVILAQALTIDKVYI